MMPAAQWRDSEVLAHSPANKWRNGEPEKSKDLTTKI
jgi:hypothetical protein